jgi:restriction system protein
MVFYAFTKAAPTWANLVIIPLFAVAAISAFNQFRKGKMLESISGPTSIKNLTWREFEELVSEAFRRKGYFVLENPDKGPDGGVDLRLRKNGHLIFVQCKHWKSKKVGVKIVRELFGVMTAKKVAHGIVVTFGAFTEDAKEFATGKFIQLIAGNQLLKLISSVQKNQQISKSDNEIQVPTCPKCGSEMKLRIAKKGKYAGQEFWGCLKFPDCRGILALKN